MQGISRINPSSNGFIALNQSKRSKLDNSLLFVCERSVWSDLAASFVSDSFSKVDIAFWNKGEPYPSWVDSWDGDYIIGFKADLIIKEVLLNKAKKAAINIHPAPPKYRGIGGYNHAIYNNDKSFGVTCHHMTKEVDYGEIIKVLRFPILDYETASSLRTRSGAFCLVLLYEIIAEYLSTATGLPSASLTWGKKLYVSSTLKIWMEEVRAENPQHRCLI